MEKALHEGLTQAEAEKLVTAAKDPKNLLFHKSGEKWVAVVHEKSTSQSGSGAGKGAAGKGASGKAGASKGSSSANQSATGSESSGKGGAAKSK
jgi:hypothetical protein